MRTPLERPGRDASGWSDDDWRRSIEHVVSSDPGAPGAGHRVVFQPVVDLRRRTVVGYEALSRFDVPDGPAAPPDRWFEAAALLGLAPELEATALSRSLAARADLPRNCFLSVNLEPAMLLEPGVSGLLAAERSLGGLVIEFTEHRDCDWDEIRRAVHALRRAGATIAIDDAGSGYAGLQQILRLRPSMLKLDRSLISSIDRDEAKASLVEMVGTFAGRIDAWVLAEGIETRAEANRVADLRVPLVQGYFFGRPSPPWATLAPGAASGLREVEAPGASLGGLVEAVPAVGSVDEAVAALVDDAADEGASTAGTRATDGVGVDGPYRVIVDDHGRPAQLVDAGSLLTGASIRTLVANLSTTPHDLAQRMSTFDGEAHRPVVVTDDRGRYVGLVTLRRLLHRIGRVDQRG